VGRVPVASVEYPHGIGADIWQRFEEANEAALVIELSSKCQIPYSQRV
jgi:hypothetical protein